MSSMWLLPPPLVASSDTDHTFPASVSISASPAISNDMETLLCARNLTQVRKKEKRGGGEQKEDEKPDFALVACSGAEAQVDGGRWAALSSSKEALGCHLSRNMPFRAKGLRSHNSPDHVRCLTCSAGPEIKIQVQTVL